jgi:hypothetical protein
MRLKPKRGIPDDERPQAREQDGHEPADPEGHPKLEDQQRRRVRTDAIEGRVAYSKLPNVPENEVQARREDDVQEDHDRDVEDVIVGRQEWKRDGGGDGHQCANDGRGLL